MSHYPLVTDFLNASEDQRDAVASRFISDILCEDYAKWMKCEETGDPDILAVSFHVHPVVPDDNAHTYLLPKDFLEDIATIYGGVLARLVKEGAPAIQVASAENLSTLKRAIGQDEENADINGPVLLTCHPERM